MSYESCPECGARKHQIVACPECGFRRSAELWSPRPKNALGKKPEIPKVSQSEGNGPTPKPMMICSRCHELIASDQMDKHMLAAHVRVIKKRKSRRIEDAQRPSIDNFNMAPDPG